MSGLKGYVVLGAKDNFQENDQLNREDMKFVSVSPLGTNRVGLPISNVGVYLVGAADRTIGTPDANEPSSIFNSAAHGVLKGDVIRLKVTTNSIEELEVYVKEVIDANNFRIHGRLSAALSAGDTFDILRPITYRTDDTGAAIVAVSGSPVQIARGPGGSYTDTTITKDTTTPANTIPMPVEIVAASGTEINITAGDINVQTSHAGANPDSVQVGDGTTILGITTANEAKAAVNGQIAANAADTMLPVKGGARYDATLPTYDDGDITNLQADINGRLHVVSVMGSDSSTSFDLDTGAGTENVLGTSIRISASGGSIEAKGQQARADSLPTTWSTEDLAVMTGMSAKLPAALGQAARAASLSTTWCTEDQAIMDGMSAKLPAALGQQARAASLSTAWCTEDQAIMNGMSAKLPAALGQQARADSMSTTWSTEDQAIMDGISGKLPATLGQKARAASLAVAWSTEDQAIMDAMSAKLPASLGTKTAAASFSVTLASDDPLNANTNLTPQEIVTHSFSSTNVTTGAWVELIASTSANIKQLSAMMTTGAPVEIGVGAAASEVVVAVLPPGGLPGHALPLVIASGSRVAIRARSGLDETAATISAGTAYLNFLG